MQNHQNEVVPYLESAEWPQAGDRGYLGSPNPPTEPNRNQQQNGDDGKPDHESDSLSRAMLTLQPGQEQNHDGCHPGKSDVLPLLSLSIRVQRRCTSGHPMSQS